MSIILLVLRCFEVDLNLSADVEHESQSIQIERRVCVEIPDKVQNWRSRELLYGFF